LFFQKVHNLYIRVKPVFAPACGRRDGDVDFQFQLQGPGIGCVIGCRRIIVPGGRVDTTGQDEKKYDQLPGHPLICLRVKQIKLERFGIRINVYIS
jgi:hypothetical protein